MTKEEEIKALQIIPGVGNSISKDLESEKLKW
jgi:hypothetical protein